MEVFVSWTMADEDVKNVLVKKLQDAGISCWESAAHCVSDFAEDCIAAIKRSSVFIVIVSDASMKEGYVQNEITTARDQEKLGKLNIVVYKITNAPYTNQFEFLLNHISFVTGNLFQRASSIAGASNIDTIVNRTQALLKRREQGNPEKPFDVFIPEFDGLKLTRTGYFVEGSRDDTLQAIEEGLTRSNVVVLEEFFGFGKRSVAKKFAECHHDRYSTAVMLHNEYGSLREFFATGLHFVNVNENAFADLQGNDLLKAKFKFLEKLSEQTLLVITDACPEPYADTELCEMLAGLKCHIFLLTQEAGQGYADWFPVIQVGRMQDAHLYELFFHHYTRAYEEEKEALIQPLTQFFANIGGHTKTVELTAATLNRDFGVHPEDLPKYLSLQGGEGLHLKDRVLQQLGNIFDTERLGGEELAALLVAAYLAVPYISEKNYRAVLETCGVRDWQVVTTLDELRWLDVDVHNRTVSMEPVVAQIVFSKIPDAYPIMQCCLDFLIEHQYQISVSGALLETSKIRYWSQLEYFLTVIGLPECAEIFAQQRLCVIEDENYDSQKMAEAIRRFEEKYPALEAKSIFATDDTDEEDTDEETFEEICDRSTVEQSATALVRGTLPFAKFIAKDMEQLFFDASANSSQIVTTSMQELSNGNFHIEDSLGMTREDFNDLLEFCRSEMQTFSEMDEDSISMSIWMECMAVFNAFFNRDYANVQIGFYNLMEHLSNIPASFFDQKAFDIILGIFQWVCGMYTVSGVFSPVVTLCEKMLQFPIPTRNHLTVLHTYVLALRGSNLYTSSLYAAYQEMLDIYDKSTQEVFELHTDMLSAKRHLLLLFATDLANGGQLDDALRQFENAEKLGIPCFLEEEVFCAHCIVEALVNTGGFQRAMAFVNQYFPPERMQTLSAQGDEQTQKILEEFSIYQNAAQDTETAFAELDDPKKHASYYQDFSRKNNGLLEQKYFKVADQALDFDFSELTVEEIADHAKHLRERAQKEKMLRLAPEAFALASEAGFRVLGYRHHFVQYIGAAAMADGKILEMFNGEGKTYTIVLTAFLHSLYGKQVYVIDRSVYLTNRNYQWMRGVFDLLGVPNTCLSQSSDITAKQSVTYTDLHTLIFGYLRYEIKPGMKRADFRADTVIIDEADTTLVDEAPLPFSIAKEESAEDLLTQAIHIWSFVENLPQDDTLYTYRNGQVILQPALTALIERSFPVPYANMGQVDAIRKLESGISTAIWCHVYAEIGRDYFIEKGIPVKENKKKGVFESFAFDPEKYYFLCRENHLDTQHVESILKKRSKSVNCIVLRDFFKRFSCVCGTTATAVSFREEFKEIYDLDCFCVPPHKPVVREDIYPPLYVTKRAKEQAIVELVQQKVEKKQPVLIITQSTEESERYSKLLKRREISHKLLNAKNADAFSDMIAEAGVPGAVLIANALAGRGADIKLGGNPELKTRHELVELGEDITALEDFVYRVPTAEQKEAPLYQKYYSILAKNKALCAAERQAVIEAGGLCVIGTSFFPEPRTEQQTIGRSGRQGDVGESWVFRSFEDEELLAFISTSVISWFRDTVIGDTDIDEIPMFRQLQQAIKTAQKNLHKSQFASIRKANNSDRHIDHAREDFIGRRFALMEGQMTLDDILREWVTDETVLEQLQLLQRGEHILNNPALDMLYRHYPQLHTVRGKKASAVLYDVVHLVLAEKLSAIDLENPKHLEAVVFSLCWSLLLAWEEFIEIVYNTTRQVSMSEQALDQYLLGEKKRLLRKPVDVLLLSDIRLNT